MEALLRELKASARRGYGMALSEAEFGVTAVAAAIRIGEEGSAVGTVSIAGPSARVTERRAQELAPLVLRTARQLASLWPLRIRAAAGSPSREPRRRPPASIAA